MFTPFFEKRFTKNGEIIGENDRLHRLRRLNRFWDTQAAPYKAASVGHEMTAAEGTSDSFNRKHCVSLRIGVTGSVR
jgi:hypothetical protein